MACCAWIVLGCAQAKAPIMKVTTGIPFTDNSPDLSLPRREVAPATDAQDPSDLLASLAAERRRLEEDARILQEREENLRQYEARLRSMQNDMDTRSGAGRSGAPFTARSNA